MRMKSLKENVLENISLDNNIPVEIDGNEERMLIMGLQDMAARRMHLDLVHKYDDGWIDAYATARKGVIYRVVFRPILNAEMWGKKNPPDMIVSVDEPLGRAMYKMMKRTDDFHQLKF